MNKKKRILAAAVVSLLVTAGVMFGLYQLGKAPIQSQPNVATFQVVANETPNSVFQRLQEEGFIKSAFVAKIEAKLSGFKGVYKGDFVLDKAWNLNQVLTYLGDSNNAGAKTATVLLVEGSWAKDMAQKIAENTNTSKARFLELWNDPTYVASLIEKYPALPKEILNNKDARVLLEGFLYPDTYQFNVDDTEMAITEKIVANFQSNAQRYMGHLANTELSHYQLITLASIVEYEAGKSDDMRKVAGVFMNRLKTNMMLQSSVTVCYALYDFTSWTDCENSQPKSPYNTYRNYGLTPGPILNPSVRAIEATLDYDHNDYLFFIADVHGDGTVYYQKTYAEHEVVRKKLLGY